MPGSGRTPAASSTSRRSTSPRPTPSGCATCRAARAPALLAGVTEANRALARPVPLFLKIAPDLSEAELAELVEAPPTPGSTHRRDQHHAGRATASSRMRAEAGGLSGRPLFARSTIVLAKLHAMTDGRLPLVGVGGIASAEEAYAKIRRARRRCRSTAPSSTAGSPLVPRILAGLDALLARDGFASVAEAVGTGRGDWLTAEP